MALRSKKKISSYIHHAFNDHSKLTVMLFFDHSFHLLLFTKGHSHYMKARWSKRKKNACFVSFAAWPGNVCICVLRFSKNSFWVCVCVSNFHRLVVFLFISFFSTFKKVWLLLWLSFLFIIVQLWFVKRFLCSILENKKHHFYHHYYYDIDS